MPSNYTSNYKLNQWAAEDKVLRTDFNADNKKIDEALAKKADQSTLTSLAMTVATLAEKSALAALETTVSKKANQTDLDDLSKTVTSHTSTLERKGNCRIDFKTYKGNGETTLTHTFSGTPLLVLVWSANGRILAARGMTTVVYETNTTSLALAAWGGNTLTFTTTKGADVLMNTSNTNYQLIAVFDAEA